MPASRAGAGSAADIATVVHGTTVGTNALLERKGAPVGVITTPGFRDALEMRRRDRPRTWGLRGNFTPIVPRDRRLEVPERTLADGTVLEPLEEAALRTAVETLKAAGAEALALIFINAYANPENEAKAKAIAASLWPNAYVNASSEILPEIREFERSSTTALNAYLQPVVSRYLERLQGGLDERGFAGEILIVQSNGGVMTLETAGRLPVRTALSGPAAGVIAAAHIAKTAGFPNVITCDMGGTSFDVSLVAGGESALAAETSVDFGLVIRTPMVEITTIGAGGGSIAWVDGGGLLQIGPDSAGSVPGPACYGLGNDRPTVTDANLLLGRINADRPIGGKLARLDVEAARLALETHVGRPLGLDPVAAAEAVIRVANARMAGAIRLVSIEKGHDPKHFAAMPFGGGGALHTGALIKDVGLASAIVPRYPGVTSAIGCTLADLRHDSVQTINALLDELDLDNLAAVATEKLRSGEALARRAGVALDRVESVIELDMLYLGQTHSVAVPIATLPEGAPFHPERTAIRDAFEERYREVYGRLLDGIPIRIMNLRLSSIGRRPRFDLAVLAPTAKGDAATALREHRQVHFDGNWHETAIYDRLALPVGAAISGPAILEQPDTTILVEPDLTAETDALGNTIIRRKESTA